MMSLMKQYSYYPLSSVTQDAYGAPSRTYGSAQQVYAAISDTQAVTDKNGVRVIEYDATMISSFMPSIGDKIDGYIIQQVLSPAQVLSCYISRLKKEAASDA